MNMKVSRDPENAVQVTDLTRPITDWDAYSEPFLSVMPSQMLKLNREVASHCIGHVADFGCGAGKIIPFVMARDCVDSYTGIDASMEMIRQAQWMIERFGRRCAATIHSTIESTTLSVVDTAISINSYYVWQDADRVLAHIRDQMHPGSRFILATLNPAIDMHQLLDEAEKELVAHPHWQAFREHNMRISASPSTQYVTLDALVGQVRQAGFIIEEAHRRHYNGGLNFLQLAV